ncbi:MAG: hypothetical protein ACO2PO_15250, partial [Candidatus Calescibacterium sp.]
ISATGCSFYLDAAIRPRQSSLEVESCADQSLIQSFSQYPRSPTYTFTQGFRFIPSRGGGNYVAEPLNKEYDSLPSTDFYLSLNGGNWDDGYIIFDIPGGGPFKFYNHLHNFNFIKVCMSTNGYIRLGEGNSWFNQDECASPRPKPPMSGTRNPDVSPWISPLWADLSFQNEYVYYISAVNPATWVSIKPLGDSYFYHGVIIQDLYPDQPRCRIMGAMDLISDFVEDEFDVENYKLYGNVYSNCACGFAKLSGTVGSNQKCNVCNVSASCQDYHDDSPLITYQGCVTRETPWEVIRNSPGSDTINLLFKFKFYGQEFNHVCITDNGFIYFTNGSCNWNKFAYFDPLASPWNQYRKLPHEVWIPPNSIAVLWHNYDPLTLISKQTNTCNVSGCGTQRHRGEMHGFGSVFKKYIRGPCPMDPQNECKALVISWMQVANFDIINDFGDSCPYDKIIFFPPNYDPCQNFSQWGTPPFDDKNAHRGRDWCRWRGSAFNLYDCGCNSGSEVGGDGCYTYETGDNSCRLVCHGCLYSCDSYFNNHYRTQVLYKNTFQVVLWSDGTIDINVREYTDPSKVSESCSGEVPRIFIRKNSGEYYILTYDLDNLPRPPFSFRLFPMGNVYGFDGLCGTTLGISHGLRYGYSSYCNYQGESDGARCYVFEWQNAHVYRAPICVTTRAILWKRSTGTGPNASDNYDIDYIIYKFEIPAKGPFAGLSLEERWKLALAYYFIGYPIYFRRSFGVDGPIVANAPTGGAWSYLPSPCNVSPNECKIAMRWRGDPYAYWIGLAVSQDFLTDLGNMIYTGGMCFSANVGGVNPQDQDKYQDIFKGLIPANLSSADSASSLFPFIKEICDPDGQVELRFKPSGVTQASARTGIEFPSNKVAGA